MDFSAGAIPCNRSGAKAGSGASGFLAGLKQIFVSSRGEEARKG